jgi:ribonuclease HII
LDIHNKTIAEVSSLLNEDKVSEQLLLSMKADSRIGIQKLLEKYYKEQEAIRKQRKKAEQMLLEERRLWEAGYSLIGGVDEAGRGPLAGPVVAACVILPKDKVITGLDDSKKLTPAKRDQLFDIISEKAEAIGLGIIDENRIDQINIYQATKEAMIKAIKGCKKAPDFLLLDAMELNELDIPQLPLIGGDGKSQSIAAASIIAKVTRDRLMIKYAETYPEYGLDKHKGYGTAEHVTAIRQYGMTPIHRRSFLTKIL